MFCNAVILAGQKGIRHLASPIYLMINLNPRAAHLQMLDALQEITSFGSLTQITIVALVTEIQKRVIATRTKKIKKGWIDPGKDNDPDVPIYAGHIDQIHFNAWTYAKSNLSASLMQTIFFELNRQMRIEQLLAHKDIDKNAPRPKSKEAALWILEKDEIKVIEKIYTDTLQIDKDADLEKWRENLIHWANTIFDQNLLWDIMRGSNMAILTQLRANESRLEKLKIQPAALKQQLINREVGIDEWDSAAKEAYFDLLKSIMLGYASEALSQKTLKQLTEQGITEETLSSAKKEAASLLADLRRSAGAFKQNMIYWITAVGMALATFALPIAKVNRN